MSFELIDNLFQTIVLLIMALSAFVISLIKGSRGIMLLSLGYGSFMTGTIFYALHIYILGYTPKVFYVSEIAWLAAYLFIFSALYLRCDGICFRPKQAILSFVPTVVSFAFKMFGPSYVTAGAFSILAGIITYVSLCNIEARGLKKCLTEVMLVVCIVLQLLIYIVSGFMSDWTVFNLYYAVDMTFTLCMASVLPIMCKEEKSV